MVLMIADSQIDKKPLSELKSEGQLSFYLTEFIYQTQIIKTAG